MEGKGGNTRERGMGIDSARKRVIRRTLKKKSGENEDDLDTKKWRLRLAEK